MCASTEQAERAARPQGSSRAAPGADGAGMVAAEHQRQVAAGEGRMHALCEAGAEVCNGGESLAFLLVRELCPAHLAVRSRHARRDSRVPQRLRPEPAAGMPHAAAGGRADDRDGSGVCHAQYPPCPGSAGNDDVRCQATNSEGRCDHSFSGIAAC
jgi:hypothetical protein